MRPTIIGLMMNYVAHTRLDINFKFEEVEKIANLQITVCNRWGADKSAQKALTFIQDGKRSRKVIFGDISACCKKRGIINLIGDL
jgi:hypothetical protein